MRIIKPGGFVLCFSQSRLSHRVAMALEDAGFEIRDMLAWKYEGQAKAFSQDHFIKKRKISDSEKQDILKSLGGRKTPQLKPQMELIILAQSPRDGTFVDNWLKHRTGLIDVSSPLIDINKFPGTVLDVPKPRERYGHVTVKPVLLIQHLIKIFSDGVESATVFDPFLGSGTTAVAAQLEGRDFIGFDIDEEMVSIARSRVEKLSIKKNKNS